MLHQVVEKGIFERFADSFTKMAAVDMDICKSGGCGTLYSRIGKEPSSRVECPQINLHCREIRNVSGICFVLFKLAINNDKYHPMEHPAVCAHHRSANAAETKVSNGPNLSSARDFDAFRYACVPVAHGPVGDFRHRAFDPNFYEPTASSEPNDPSRG